MKKLAVIGALVMAVAVVNGGEKAKGKEAANGEKEAVAAPAIELTLSGKVEKVEKKKKDGTVFMTWYRLVGDDGVTTHLPKGKVEEYVGEKVKVTGMGSETKKKDKVERKLETIASIEKIAADSQPAK